MRFTSCGFLLIVLMLSCLGCSRELSPERINGVSLVATRDSLSLSEVQPVLNLKANYVAVMPFGFTRSEAVAEILYNLDQQWYGETFEGVGQYIDLLHQNGLKVMVKPQLWLGYGNYTGHLKMATEKEWKLLETSYRNFILDFAAVAEAKQAAMFCIGTELETFIEARPEFWKALIQDVKQVYHGKLTYAANWDEYTDVPFWNALDYIGIDAYFPVSEVAVPTVADAQEGWQQWKPKLKGFSENVARPILFTEYGYRSITYAGKTPWASHREGVEVNLKVQENLLTALYETYWSEPWFAGGFLWKWHPAYDRMGAWSESQFTPQKKPAEEVVRKYYAEN